MRTFFTHSLVLFVALTLFASVRAAAEEEPHGKAQAIRLIDVRDLVPHVPDLKAHARRLAPGAEVHLVRKSTLVCKGTAEELARVDRLLVGLRRHQAEQAAMAARLTQATALMETLTAQLESLRSSPGLTDRPEDAARLRDTVYKDLAQVSRYLAALPQDVPQVKRLAETLAMAKQLLDVEPSYAGPPGEVPPVPRLANPPDLAVEVAAPPGDARERWEHLLAAQRHLRAAGSLDMARRVAAEAKRLAPLARARRAADEDALSRRVEGLAKDVEALRDEVRGLRRLLEEALGVEK